MPEGSQSVNATIALEPGIPDYEWVVYIHNQPFGIIGDKVDYSLVMVGPMQMQLGFSPPTVAGGVVGLSILIIIAALAFRTWLRRRPPRARPGH